MRKFMVVAVVVIAAAAPAFAQEEKSLIQVYPLGPLVGLYTVSFEQVIGDSLGLAWRPSYHNPQWALLRNIADNIYGVEGLKHNDYNAWRLGLTMSVNYFIGERAPKGFFMGGGATVGYLTVADERENPDVTESTFLLGGSVHLGYRWLLGSIAIAPRASLGGLFGLDDFDALDDQRLQEYGRGLDWELGVDLAYTF